MKRKKEPKIITGDLADLKTISEKLEILPRDKLMYVAGAVTALVATQLPIPDQDAS